MHHGELDLNAIPRSLLERMVQEILHDPENGTAMWEQLKDALISQSVKDSIPRKDILGKVHDLMKGVGLTGDEIHVHQLLPYVPLQHQNAINEAAIDDKVRLSSLPSPILLDIID